MTKVVINLCGVKSKGGVTVVNNYLKQNNNKNLYVIYDNPEFKKYIKNFDNQNFQYTVRNLNCHKEHIVCYFYFVINSF